MYLDGQQNGTWINATKDRKDMKDSYMGERTRSYRAVLMSEDSSIMSNHSLPIINDH